MCVVSEPFWAQHREKVMCKTTAFAMLGHKRKAFKDYKTRNRKAHKMTTSILGSIVVLRCPRVDIKLIYFLSFESHIK